MHTGCPCGGIGRRDGFKIRCLRTCLFESGQGHHLYGLPQQLKVFRVAIRFTFIILGGLLCLPVKLGTSLTKDYRGKRMSATDHQRTDRKKISQLVFDRKNPRLALELIGGNSPDDGQIIKYLDDISPLSELVTSILENGYIAIEPLIVIKEGDVYRVLEGNRRLAAIKLIADKKFREEHDLFSIDDSLITERVRETIKEIPVYEVDDEKDARALIGFKHIKGPYKWNSFAKAKYVTDQYRENYSLDDPISAIAKKIGDENSTVRNLIGGMLVLEQALDRGIFDITDRQKRGSFAFSHLYTALGRSEYQKYLGLEKRWLEKPNLSESDSKLSF